jgi:hypothetical protein
MTVTSLLAAFGGFVVGTALGVGVLVAAQVRAVRTELQPEEPTA